ncbi:hypothetical protein O181_082662 [Austropuccinia psidii MF-1]|uniref:DDE Tnp4 domain-containing protein n=1 Tax=Austropuccinia psidii MF-1 TaxID=1389203 RepID=A0A9Q3FQW0_9BASI|nr:hypothetical protein [Austropuccinia psidii MF-1]
MDDPFIQIVSFFSIFWAFHLSCYGHLRRCHRQPIQRGERFNPWNNNSLYNEASSNGSQEDIRSLTIEEKVGVTLYRLGHGSSYETVGHLFNIGKATAYRVLQEVVHKIVLHLHDLTISLPDVNNDAEWNVIRDSFKRRQGLTNIIGAIDGTHIPIIPPPNDEWNSYVNRKGWHSIVFQCIVDGEGNFRNVFGGLPGSVHDSRLFRKSKIGRDLLNGIARFPQDCLLIGDSGYSCKVPILTPSKNARSEEHQRFNNIHSSTRMVVEQAFGRLKNRFRCLLSPQAILPMNTGKVMIACMILHNILNGRNA